ERDEEHEQEPQGLGPAGQVATAEDIDEDPDQDPDPDDPQKELDHRPEQVQERIRRRRSYGHSSSFASGWPTAIAPRWPLTIRCLALDPDQAQHLPRSGSSASPGTGETNDLPGPIGQHSLLRLFPPSVSRRPAAGLEQRRGLRPENAGRARKLGGIPLPGLLGWPAWLG